MKISYNWLKNYIDVKVNPENISEILTDSGLEIDGMQKIQTIKGGLEGLVVGEVLTKEKHPDADKLNLTTINIGVEEVLNIVCGASNLEVGQKVVVATIGTTLYSGDDSFKIKKSKIRGQLSEGMICAEDEIGLGKGHDGIMVLDASTAVGTLAKAYFNIEDDYELEIGLTPNRADATGHIGVARDLVAVLGQKQEINLVKPSVDDFKVDNADLNITVEVEDAELCKRYSGVTINNITIKESPDWLKNRLLSIGLTPVNNVVDVTNFVMHETGQPLHAFDVAKIKGNKVIVKTVADKTKFTTLDDTERELSEDDLMICNTEDGMCIAGVFGGSDSGVSKTTTSIFLESAYFDAVSVRKSAKRHGLNTDASFRFERGADPRITIYALKRAANLIKEVSGGTVSSEIVDVYPTPIEDFSIDFSFDNCDKVIGQKIDRTVIKKILIDLEIQILEENGDQLKLSVPPFKVDVQREIDVIEEVLRIYGYNNIVLPDVLKSSLSYRTKPEKEKVTNLISDLLVSNGFNEILNNSLTKADYYKETADSLVRIKNPLSKDLDVLRQSMVYDGLETIVYNQNRRNSDVKLFEWGKTYFKTETKFKEHSHLSMFISGASVNENWDTANTGDVNFYQIKGVVNTIMEKFGMNKFNVRTEESELTCLDYGLKYKVNNIDLVEFGKIDAATQKQFDINNEVFYVIFNYDNLIKLVGMNKVVYKEVSKFPAVRRDLALLIDKAVAYSSIQELASKQDKKLLKAINLFDVYEGKNLPEGKKSYAVSFQFQDETKTLVEKQIDKVMTKI
ncbi:MAG: phenylalanine--tRNA ligase subunit beta, partial [Flavobacteriales bacterium]|nr:phenylalanine--tRNA ligase subunit beta [Flavobacteriales bacterium]